MELMEKQILVLAVSKTKSLKSVLDYAIKPIGSSTYRKGLLILQDWVDTEDWYDIPDKYIGTWVKAQTQFIQRSNGKIVEKIVKIIG